MRLARLDLFRFGPFTDRALAFREDARLHVVYGPNEAGKTSAHAAVRNLLFGFPHQTTFDFLHRSNELLLGGEVIASDGRRLAFHRRKGTKQTLRNPDGTALPDDALAGFTGAVTEDVFARAFGLNAETLRKGALDLMAADGESGGSLMAAASGLRGLVDLRKKLESEAGQIFTPRARQRRINEIEDRRKAATDLLRQHELRAEGWKKLTSEKAALESELVELDARRKDSEARLHRLDRLKRLAPILRRIGEVEAALTDLGPLPAVASDVPRKLAGILSEWESARKAADIDARARVQAREALEAIAVEKAMLDHSSRIEDLLRRSGGIADALRDLPKVRSQGEEFAREVEAHAVSLGLPLDRLESGQPSDPLMVEIQSLARRGADLAQALERSREALRREEALLATSGEIEDPRLLQDRLAALRNLASLIDQCRKLDTEVARDSAALEEDVARLFPPITDLATLQRTPLPGEANLVPFAQGFEGLAQKAARLREQGDNAAAEQARAEARVSDLSQGSPVPSAELIAQARARRDAIWSRLRDGGPPAPQETIAFEAATREADQLADAAARDANRVAEYAAALRLRDQSRARAEAAAQQLQALQVQKDQLTQEWLSLWAPIMARPATPSEMQVWLVSARTLLQRQRTLAERLAALKGLNSDIASLQPALEKLQADCGVAGDLAPIAALAAIEERLRDHAARWERAREARSRALQHRREGEEIEIQLQAWTERWCSILTQMHLPASASREQALASVEIWKKVPPTLRQRDDRQRRVEGMEHNIEQFESDVLSLVAGIASDLESLEPRTAVERLNTRLREAMQQASRREEARKVHARCEASAQASGQLLQDLEARLASLMQQIGTAEDPHRISERFIAQRGFHDELARLRADFANAGDGQDEASLREQLSAFDPDTAEGERAVLQSQSAHLVEETRRIYAAGVEIERQLKEAELRTSAELAHQQRRNAEAELEEAAHEWAVLKTAGVLLDAALQRHRAGQQDPLMRRAADLFATLTGGSYAGLEQRPDDEGAPHLVARRTGGSLIEVPGLSEGTRDQLYLALRLAYVEDYARRAEAAPFLADDLFASFDDRRTAHGLKVLAEIGAHVQPILFTHHAHVVDLARDCVGDAMLDVITL